LIWVAECFGIPLRAVACKWEARLYPPDMVLTRAYQFRQDEPRLDLRELDWVALTAAPRSATTVTRFCPGAEGTIASVYRDGEAYVVEFPTPLGALATR
jgi:hypothetical protein